MVCVLNKETAKTANNRDKNDKDKMKVQIKRRPERR